MTTHAELKQPPGLFLLFITEMWERFSYYGMRAILVLFLVSTNKGGFGWTEKQASELYGWYTGLVYLTPLFGGYLADRFLGTHRCLLIGGAIIAFGHFTLAFGSALTFYLGLLLIIIGTGFFKSNVSTMVGQLYHEDDHRRDAGFTIYYMGINLGSLLGISICGFLGESSDWGWHYGFGAAGIGMVAGLICYSILKRKYLGTIGDAPGARVKAEQAHGHSELTRVEWDRMAVILIVSFFVIFFWTAFEQQASSLNLFIKNFTERHVMGMEFPASWLQTVNPAVILLGGPVFAWLWVRLAEAGREPSTPVKMAMGLLLLAIGYGVMVVATMLTAGNSLVSPLWPAAAYVFFSCGELCLSPVGLSLVTKLAPVQFASVLMGCWFLANFVSNVTGGYVAGLTEEIRSGQLFHVFGGQADFFLVFVVSSGIAGLALLALSPTLKRMMHGA